MATSNGNKNSMLPTYTGNYSDMIGALNVGEINSPCWFFLEDKNTLAFLHWEKDSEGTKTLVPHAILMEQMQAVSERLESIDVQLEGLNDPTTGEPIKVVEYITETVEPIHKAIEEIENEGATIMVLSLEEV